MERLRLRGRLFDFGSGKLIRPHEVPREPPGGEPPDKDRGDLDRRVTRLEVEQRHLASKAEGLFTTQWGKLMESLVEGDLALW